MNDRPRASVAVLRAGGREVLMVRHRRVDGSEYWQLPGGGVQEGETPEAAAVRELLEETGLHGRVVRHLFTLPYRLGLSTTFLVEIDPSGEALLGSDPEEHAADHRKLVGIAWRTLADVRDNTEIRHVIDVLALHIPWTTDNHR